MSSFKNLFKFINLDISLFLIKDAKIVLSIIKEIKKIKVNIIKEIVVIFIENINISFEAKEVT